MGKSSYKTEIGRVRGLGSAKSGGHHWLVHRATAVGNLFLVGWLFLSILLLPNFAYETVAAWMAKPSVAVPLILLLINVFWHLRMGWQVLIEDYFHEAGGKLTAVMLLNFYVFGAGALAIFAVAKHAFVGVAG